MYLLGTLEGSSTLFRTHGFHLSSRTERIRLVRLHINPTTHPISHRIACTGSLTGVTVLTERIIADDIKHDPAKRHQVPRTIADFVDAYQQSDIATRMAQELEDHLKDTERRKLQTADFKIGVREDKAKSVPKNDPFTVRLVSHLLGFGFDAIVFVFRRRGYGRRSRLRRHASISSCGTIKPVLRSSRGRR